MSIGRIWFIILIIPLMAARVQTQNEEQTQENEEDGGQTQTEEDDGTQTQENEEKREKNRLAIDALISKNPDLLERLKELIESNKGQEDVSNFVDNACGGDRGKKKFAAFKVWKNGNTTKPHMCQYLECVRAQYLLRQCPDGTEVTKKFIKKGYSKRHPCKKHSRKCKLTLKKKGLGGPIDLKICGIDLVWVVDISCSIAPEDKKKMKKFMLNIMRRLPIRPPFTQVGGLAYAKNVDHIMYLNTHDKQSRAMKAVGEMRLDVPVRECGTSTDLALKTAREVYFSVQNGNRIPDEDSENPEIFRDVCVVMTDGMTNPTERQNNTIQQAKLLKEKGVHVFLIVLPNHRDGLGTPQQQEERRERAQREFSEIPTDNESRYNLNSFDELDDIVNELTARSCFIV